MHRFVVSMSASFWLAALMAQADAAPVALTAADGVKVHGEYWPAADAAAPLVLMFHQAGSSSAEYAPIAPRLNRAGYSVLAIDQRSGDGAFGGKNLTVTRLGRSTTYDAALPDLEAAVAWSQKRDGANGPVIVWGSSYSAALVFLLAARHPAEIRAVLAFSPGEYLGAPRAVRTAARSVTVPVFIDQASSADEVDAARKILDALPGPDKTQFVPKHGVHGSATLRADRNAEGAEENWEAVMAFLERVKTRR